MMRFGVGAVSPLWQAGFNGNPFRSLTEDEWGEVALLPPAVAAALQQSPAPHLQIIGDKGIGKSSALRAILREASRTRTEARIEYLPFGTDTFRSNPSSRSLFCLDEAQRLNPFERHRLLILVHERNIQLCVGTHEDFTPAMYEAGQTIQTITLAERSSDEHAAIWQGRLTYFARPEAAHATLSHGAISFLYQQFRDDLRAAERFLYHYFQKNVSAPHEITEADLAGALALSD